MRFLRCTELDCEPAEAIRHARSPRLLAYVAAPWLRFDPLEPPALPDEWKPGRYRVRLRAFGVIPFGEQWIGIRAVEQRGDRLLLHDEGSGGLVRVWNHRLETTPTRDGRTRYCGRIEIEAGRRAPVIAWLARRFFAHRQRRWRRLVANGFDYER